MKALWHHARGLAFSAQGNVRAAGAELDSLRAIAAKVPADMIIILNPASKSEPEAVRPGNRAPAEGSANRGCTQFR
jgi:hypothetical protein